MTQVTIVVITHNNRERLLTSMRFHEQPVVVVDNASSDGSADAIERQFPQHTVLRLRKNIGYEALNLGARAAATRYVAFTCDDSAWESGTLQRAERELDTHDVVGMVAANVVYGAARSPHRVCESLLASPLTGEPGLPGVPVLGFAGCSCIVRRQPFLDTGGFDRLATPGGLVVQRVALDMAEAGWAIRFDAQIVNRIAHQEKGTEPWRTVRSDILTSLMRRPAKVVIGRAARQLRLGLDGRLGVLMALCAVPAALRRRQLLGERIELRVCLLDQMDN